MKASPFCVSLIKSFEGCKLKAYPDSKGIPTIGYGSIMFADGSRVKLGDAITLDQAEKLLAWQIELKSIAIDALLKRYIISQKRFDVLCSLVYNIGISAFEKSTLLRLIKKSQKDPAIADAFLMWRKISVDGKLVDNKGLINRRKKEIEIWFSETK